MSLASLRSTVAASPNSTHNRTRAASRRLCTAMALPDQFILKDKTVVVTGASRGIGLEFVKQLLDKGNTVVAAVRNPDAPELQKLKASNPNCHALALDVGDMSSIQTWASNLAEVSPTIDVLINNAGVLYSDTWDTATPEDMMESYKVNTMGPMFTIQTLVQRDMLPSGALVATLTSLVGSITENGSGRNYAYRCSKIAANMVMKSMSIDLAQKGITCTILHPGYVKTDMTGGAGLIEVPESVKGMLDVLESKDKPLNGEWYHTTGRHLPW